jgi:hypothetical protein
VVGRLDAVLGRCPVLPQPLRVYRGIGIRAFIERSEPGHRFRVAGFWSTSHEEGTVRRFVERGGALLELELPAGMPVYNMETLEGAGGGENELLLPRGLLWEIVSFDEMKKEETPPALRRKMTCVHHAIARIRLRVVVRART